MISPVNNTNEKFYKAMDVIRQRTPEESNILPKYVPESCKGKPVQEMFRSSSIAEAPIEWLELSQFKVCPLDIGYCIFKVHESLSIMVTLQASSGDESADFFARMPGFDDIFDIWLCMVCCSNLADPIGINNFLSTWSRLPVFPSRFHACCAYLEAAVQQIQTIADEL